MQTILYSFLNLPLNFINFKSYLINELKLLVLGVVSRNTSRDTDKTNISVYCMKNVFRYGQRAKETWLFRYS